MKFCIVIKGRNWTFQLADSLCKLNNLESLVTTYPKFHVKKYKVPNNKVKSVFSLYIIESIIRRFIHPFLKKIGLIIAKSQGWVPPVKGSFVKYISPLEIFFPNLLIMNLL